MIRRNIRRKLRNPRYRRKFIKILILITASVFLLFCAVFMLLNRNIPEITLKVKKQSIFQDEAVPAMDVAVLCKGDKKTVLDRKTKYLVKDFVNELNEGKGYHLKYEINEKIEGSYPITIVLDKKVKHKLQNQWHRKIRFKSENGTFEVKNKFGTWEKNKFKKLDGTYVTSDFVVSKGKTYYFDEDGKKVTGKQVIGKRKYVFRKDGTLKSAESRVNPDKPMIALTFDDGPGKYTDTLLNQLDKYNARATFFMLGENASKYPDAIKKMIKIGCELGNHSATHTSLVKLDADGIRQEIKTTEAAVAAAAGPGTKLLRPPYGALNDHVKSVAELPVIMWSLDTEDWKKKDAAKITEYVLNNIKDGDIVLMHDIHKFSVDSALTLIPKLVERGYQLVTVSEMAEARGIEMKNGEKYFRFSPN